MHGFQPPGFSVRFDVESISVRNRRCAHPVGHRAGVFRSPRTSQKTTGDHDESRTSRSSYDLSDALNLPHDRLMISGDEP